MTSFAALGFDPAPGDPVAAGSLARNLRAAADELHAVHVLLMRAGSTAESWTGDAAMSFSGRLGHLPAGTAAAAEACAAAGEAVASFAVLLPELQRRARQLEADAEAARHRQRLANAALDDAVRSFLGGPLIGPTLDEASVARARLESAMAGDELAAILSRSRRLQEEHEAWARQTAEILSRAAADAIAGEGVVGRIGAALYGTPGAQAARPVVVAHAAELETASDRLAATGAVLGLITPFTGPLAPVLGGAALTLGGLSLATKGTLAATGHASVDDIASDALTLALPSVGVAAARTEQVTSASRALPPIGPMNSARGISRWLPRRFDAQDAETGVRLLDKELASQELLKQRRKAAEESKPLTPGESAQPPPEASPLERKRLRHARRALADAVTTAERPW